MSVEIAQMHANRDSAFDCIENAKLLNAIVEKAPDAIITIDRESIIRSFNPAAEKLFGYTCEEAVGKSVQILMPPRFREQHDAFVADYLTTGERRIIGSGRVVIGQQKDGSTFPVELFVSETTVGDDQVFTGFIRDLSVLDQEHRRVQELQSKLFHVSRLSEMGQLATGLAHEINQPLAAITNYALAGRNAAGESSSPSGQAIGGFFEKIEQQARRAAEIIRRLRTYVQGREIEREDADLYILVEEALALAMVGPSGRGIRVNLELAPDTPRVHVDRVQIQQVLVNLVRNGIDAMEGLSRREITIHTVPSEDRFVRVSVSDLGQGISDDVAKLLFDAFVTTKAEGLGVGLSISKVIVEAHGGRLWFTRNASAGVTFHFTLPSALMAETGAEETTPSSPEAVPEPALRNS